MKISTRGPEIPRLQGKMIGLDPAAAKYPTNSEGGSDGGENGLERNFWRRFFNSRFCQSRGPGCRGVADQFCLVRFGRNCRGDQVLREAGLLQKTRARHDHDLCPQWSTGGADGGLWLGTYC